MTARQPSWFARAIEPFAAGLWVLFILWTIVVALVWTTGFGEAELAAHIANPGLRDALALFLHALDATWVTLAAANIYLSMAEEESLATARRRALLVIAVVAVIATLSTTTGLPLGAIRYTSRLGMQIGPVPFALPLLWFAIVAGARSLVLRIAPRASHGQVSLAVGLLTALTDANLEHLAWKTRALWIWYPAALPAPAWPPVQNYATWFVAAGALAFTMREETAAPAPGKSFPRPAIVFLILNAVFLATHVIHG